MTNLTIDRQAVDFYNEFAQQVETFGILNVLDEREDRVLFNKGKKALQAVIDHKKVNRELYTTEECRYVVDQYINNDKGLSRTQLGNMAYNQNPGSGHSVKSWSAMFGRMETLDNTNPAASKFIVNTELAVVASEVDPERFA